MACQMVFTIILLDSLRISGEITIFYISRLVFTSVSNASGFHLRVIASPENSEKFRAIQEQLRNEIPIENPTFYSILNYQGKLLSVLYLDRIH